MSRDQDFPVPSFGHAALARADEEVALKALFERVFFGTSLSPQALEALSRIRFLTRQDAPALDPEATRYILLNRGETGIGKTRIFRQFRQTAAERRIPVYEIHCYDVEGIPFKPFLQVIREILCDFELSEALREKYTSTLETILPEICILPPRGEAPAPPPPEPRAEASGADGAGAPVSMDGDSPRSPRGDGCFPFVSSRGYGGGGTEADKIRVFDSLTRLLFEITALKPVVILVHDLHYGDHATVELLRYIGRNLQLRNSRIAAIQSGRRAEVLGSLPKPSGPELGDDEGEWRELTSRSARGDSLSEAKPEPLGLDSAESFEDRPVRLMILANYSGFPEESHYLERAFRGLGDEPFAFHGEVRTLPREEAGPFIERSLARCSASAPPGPSEGASASSPPGPLEGASASSPPGPPEGAAIDPAVVDLIYRYSQGFPSYMHEALRLACAFLPEGAADSPAVPRLTVEALSRVLGLEEEGAASDGAGAPAEASGPPLPPRMRILERRLLAVSAEEKEVLRVLALARKPQPAALLSKLLFRDRPADFVLGLLSTLEKRWILERVRHEFPRRGEECGYYFRMLDDAQVVAQGISPEIRRRLHQWIGEECRARLSEEGDQKAYEIFYHLRRGDEPASAVPFGILAAKRFARAFSLEKAVQVCEELLGILPEEPAPEGGKGAAPGRSRQAKGGEKPLRRQVQENLAMLHLRLKEYTMAEGALGRILEAGGDSLADQERLEVLLKLAEVTRAAGDSAPTMKILSKAFRLSSEENPQQAARLHMAMARAHLDRQDAKRTINFCLNGLKLLKNLPDVPENAGLYVLLARAHHLRGDFSHAVDNFQRALDWLERRSDEKAATAEVLDDLGRVYLERGNYFRAARYLYKSLEVKRREQDILGLSRSYDELGRVYLRTGDELKTIEHLNRSLALKERVGDLAGLNPTLGILGDLYFRLGQFQRAIRYFKREVDNSQALSDTGGLVVAFLHLGWVYLELGELKQVENLCRQISILAGEFKLKAQEAEGARLWGALEAMERNWNGADKHLRQALEVHAKLGDRRREVECLLGLAEMRFNRELYDESLKFAAKALVIAEELKAVDLQALAHVIKGNVHRFLKGGNAEKAKELLRRALELAQPQAGARLLFDILYSLAKVYHYDREFAEAGNYYGKAEAILRRVADGLPEDMAARFFEDRRRKIFFEDSARFRKEVQSRAASGSAIDLRERAPAVDLRDRPPGVADYKDLTARLLRVHGAVHELDFHARLLSEAIELLKAERGILVTVQNRQYQVLAASGFGNDPGAHPEYPCGQSLAEEAVRRGRPIVCAGAEDEEKLGKLLRLSGPVRRAVLAIPVLTNERVFGGLYFDRPLTLGSFSSRDLVMAEGFSAHAGSSFENRRLYEAAIREPLTGFCTPTYFLERIKDAFRWYNLHGRPFYLVGYYLPTLEDSIGGGGGLGEKVSQELTQVLPRSAAASWWNPILAVLIFDGDLAVVESTQARIAERLGALLKEEVEGARIGPEPRFNDGATLYYELRRSLLPEECDTQTITEIRRLLARDITLKEAKRILEKHIIENTLRKTGGNITHAARELGIHRPQLSNLLKKYALKREVYERELDIRLNPLDN